MSEALRPTGPRAVPGVREIIRQLAPTPPALAAIREDARNRGSHKLTMKQIDAEVAAARRPAAKRKARKQPTQ